MLKRDYRYENCYYDEKKFDSGYFGHIDIANSCSCPPNWYFVSLAISKKKKRARGYSEGTKDSNTQTTNIGSGIEPLIWAKQCIIDFIKDREWRKSLLPIYICVGGEDAQRKRIYKWALTKIGFKEGTYWGKTLLVYKIDKTE